MANWYECDACGVVAGWDEMVVILDDDDGVGICELCGEDEAFDEDDD